MIRSMVIVGLAMSFALVAGCQKEEAPAPSSDANVATDANAAKPPADANAAKAAKAAEARAKAAEAAKAIDDAKVKAAEKAREETASQIEKVQSLIAEGKLDDARQILKALNEKLATLAPGIQEKIKALQTALKAKTAAGDLKIPDLPK